MIGIFLISCVLVIVAACMLIVMLRHNLFKHKCGVTTPVRCHEKYGNHRLPDFARKSIVKRLNEYMHDRRPWLQDGLTLADLASALGVNPHYLSQAINAEYGKSFVGFINEHRVLAACQMLRVGNNKSMLDLALESGFASKSSFNRIFKQCLGITPTEYRRKYRLTETTPLENVS